MSSIVTNGNIKGSLVHIINKEIKKINTGNDRVSLILQENYWTDVLQCLVDFGNSRFLKNFRYRLEMEEVNDIQNDE
jgi:hypothetical protein